MLIFVFFFGFFPYCASPAIPFLLGKTRTVEPRSMDHATAGLAFLADSSWSFGRGGHTPNRTKEDVGASSLIGECPKSGPEITAKW
jgi:hypothetical protein